MAFNAEEKGYIPFANPPTQTNAGSDTTLTFTQEVNWITMQNNTAINVNFAFDSAASPGSFVAVPGALINLHKDAIGSVHLYTATAQNINGVVAGNIVVLGAL